MQTQMKTKTMKITQILTLFSAAALGLAAVGCDSTATCADGGVCPDAGAGGTGKGGASAAGGTSGAAGANGAGGAGGPTLFAVSPGAYCYEVTAIAAGYVDGCGIDVAGAVSTPAAPSYLPVTYYSTPTVEGGVTIPAGTIAVGTDGALGRGVIDQNKATLLRDGTSSVSATCSIHQTDTSMFELIAENTFTIAVTEVEDMWAATCTAADGLPAGGTCTSTWKWTMKIMSPQTVTPPKCGRP